jgi:MoaA/NifB/PqqE/SkfB family radical SAM enzyme
MKIKKVRINIIERKFVISFGSYMPFNFLDLHIVDFCQLDCRHCFLNKGNSVMPLDMIKEICTDFLQTRFPLPQSHIVLSGGDPLLHPEFPEVCRIVKDLGCTISLSTNGILVPQYISVFHPNDSIQVSIDGDKTTHDYIRGEGVYEKAVLALNILKEENIPHSISFTINKQNEHCLDHVIDLCRESGSYLLNFNLYQPIRNNDLDPIPFSQWLELRQSAEKKLKSHDIIMPDICFETGCIAGILGLSVLPDGTYWDCSRNQNIIGRYPQKIREVLFWDHIRNHTSRDQFQTCCRRLAHG